MKYCPQYTGVAIFWFNGRYKSSSFSRLAQGVGKHARRNAVYKIHEGRERVTHLL